MKAALDWGAKQGVHGSSTLIMDKNPTGYAENWQAVQAFLQNLAF